MRLRCLWKFCDIVGTTPADYTDPAKGGDGGLTKAEDLLQDFVTISQKKGLKGSYIAGVKNSVISWLSYNHVRLWRTIKVRDSQGQYEGATPTVGDLRNILSKADLRCKVSITLMAFAGLRPETLGSGTNGLKISDFPEIVIRGRKVEFSKTPTMIKVRRELSKTGRPYFTFLSDEGSGHLRRYLEDRAAHGETPLST